MTGVRIATALALVAIVSLPAQARHAPRPIACVIVTGGGEYVIEGPCLARLDKLREMNRRGGTSEGKSP